MSRLAGGKTPEEVLRYVKEIPFPAHKADLIHAARRNGAPNDIVWALSQLPKNDFASPEELIESYPQLPY